MAHTIDDDVTILKENIDKLDKAISCADENGLFTNCDKKANYVVIDTCAGIVKKMIEANNDLDAIKLLAKDEEKNAKLAQAWQKYRSARHDFNSTLNTASFQWRFQYTLGGPYLIYLLCLLGMTFLVWFVLFSSLLNTNILEIPAYAYVWGLIGAILQGFWFLWQQISDRRFRKVWLPWYLLLPFMGCLFGALTYVIYSAGFFAVTGVTAVESNSIIILLCAIAGFSSNWVVETLEKITNSIKIGK